MYGNQKCFKVNVIRGRDTYLTRILSIKVFELKWFYFVVDHTHTPPCNNVRCETKVPP